VNGKVHVVNETSLTPAEAGKLAGRSKGAIIKAIHDGRLSAEREVNGAFTIQPVELFRVYPVVNGNGHHEVNGNEAEVNDSQHFEGEVNTQALQAEIDQLRGRLADKEEVVRAKDQVIASQVSTIEVLTAENTRLTAVIAQLQPQKAKVGWWQRLLGGGA
jgi:hypothetical protein